MSAVGEHNLARLVELAYERRGNYPSLLYEDRWHASGELFERSRRLAGGLAAMGVAAGDRVAVSMANCPEVGIAYHALWRAGAVVTPATFLLPEADLQHVLGDSGAVAVITTPEFVPKVRAAAGRSPQLRHVICAGPVDDGMTLALADLEQAAPAAIVPRADDDLAALLYTGGTTGRAKGVMLSHRNLHYTGAAASAASHVPGINRGLATLPLSHSYGILTTIAALISSTPADRVRDGSVGIPVPETEVRIRSNDGRELPPGEDGEIVVRSPAVMQGYWNAPEVTAQAIEDGWLHTGDVGHLDEDGYLYVVDRLKDLIIRGGFNVYPRDIEDAMLQHPAVEMVAVIGRPHPRHGEEVVAFVAPRRDAELEPGALIAWAREHIGGYKYPREVHLVDAIPLTPVGKTDRKLLRAQLGAA